ncbi:Protein of unknown function [Pyronema omphalodes CBS 100304]|uniref:Uncharacterized protein n=1 Tax=Pyronema omphalodes (strain CBS 100304) TaxID=1076935 RepID=U4LB72_PYROM|nr:Protein of unknown function [Pyronema omphalodes CBS 100304]
MLFLVYIIILYPRNWVRYHHLFCSLYIFVWYIVQSSLLAVAFPAFLGDRAGGRGGLMHELAVPSLYYPTPHTPGASVLYALYTLALCEYSQISTL